MTRRLQRISLRSRLLLSYVAILAVAATTVVIAVPRLANPTVSTYFDGDRTKANNAVVNGIVKAEKHAVWIAAVIAVAASFGMAVVMSRLLLRTLTVIRSATADIAAGHYERVIEIPHEPELGPIARDINALAESLADTERRRARLVSDVAHELRTPLTTLQGQLEGIMDGVIEMSDETIASMTDDIARLVHITTDLANLSRAEERAYDLDFADTNLYALASSVVARLKPQYDEQGVALLVTGQPVAVWADAGRVTQLLTNVVGNALMATASGGTVTVHVSERSSGQPAGHDATVVVSDTGRGIAAHDLGRIFQRFERVTVGDAAPSTGSGIGLTIARGIAEAHHGTLTATSPGLAKGATFMLTLPVEPRDHHEQHESARRS